MKNRNIGGTRETDEPPTTADPAPSQAETDGLDDAALVGWLLAELENTSEGVLDALRRRTLTDPARRFTEHELYRITTEMLASDPLIDRPVDVGADPAPLPGLLGRLQGVWWSIDRLTNSMTRALHAHAVGRIRRYWTIVGLCLTAMSCVLIVMHAWGAAIVVVFVRLVGSAASGGPALVSSSRPASTGLRRSLARSLVSCLAGHLTDLATGIAIAVALAQYDRAGWAVVVASAGALAMYGSLARVAAERAGVRVSRSTTERFARNGFVLLALGWAAVGGTAAAVSSTIPRIALVAVGLGGYGLFEIARIGVTLFQYPRPRRAVTVSVDAEGQVHVSSPDLVRGQTAA